MNVMDAPGTVDKVALTHRAYTILINAQPGYPKFQVYFGSMSPEPLGCYHLPTFRARYQHGVQTRRRISRLPSADENPRGLRALN